MGLFRIRRNGTFFVNSSSFSSQNDSSASECCRHGRRDAYVSGHFLSYPSEDFGRIPGSIPFNSLSWKPHVHLAIFVHRVDDLPPGLYFLVRDPAQKKALERALTRAD